MVNIHTLYDLYKTVFCDYMKVRVRRTQNRYLLVQCTNSKPKTIRCITDSVSLIIPWRKEYKISHRKPCKSTKSKYIIQKIKIR